ncbi:hypothetical protein [Labilibaculum euxinus]
MGIPKQFLQEPIIEQDIMQITHKDTGKDLIRKGRALEAIVLTRTLAYKAEHHIIVNGTRTMFLIR